jgi:hypothetical protein
MELSEGKINGNTCKKTVFLKLKIYHLKHGSIIKNNNLTFTVTAFALHAFNVMSVYHSF